MNWLWKTQKMTSDGFSEIYPMIENVRHRTHRQPQAVFSPPQL